MKTKRRPKAKPENVIHANWKETRVFCGPYPASFKRFFQLETLTGALEKMLMERDRFFHAALTSSLGDAPLSVVEGDLTYEDSLHLVFQLTAGNRARKRATWRLCVAKNHEECSAGLKKEYEALIALHGRAPERVVTPHRMGSVFLPDRHRRKQINREVFAFLTDPLPGSGPLYVASDAQLGPKGPQPRRFSVADTEALKRSIVRLVARCYDPADASGLDPADLAPEHLSMVKRGQGEPEVFLLQCPRLRRRFRPERMLRRLLFGVLKSDRCALPLAPARPERFVEALAESVGNETARAWCATVVNKAMTMDDAGDDGRPGRAYLDALLLCLRDL